MPEDPADPFAHDANATQGVSTSYYRDDAPISRDQLLEKLLSRDDESEKYIILQQIAEGGMGTIFQVEDQDLKRRNVLKIMRPEVEKDPHLFERFVEEARITGMLEHPNIVPVHDLGVLGGQKLYFSMKQVHGEELAAILTRLRQGDMDTVAKYGLYPLLTIFRKVCDATAFAHACGIIHRDLKPDNIMVGEYGEVLLMDWGLARNTEDRRTEPEPEFDQEEEDTLADPDDGRTRYGVIKGTPAYMSPEMALGRVDLIDTRADIFLLGATLYAIATLYPPFTGKDVYEIVDNAAENNYLPPQDRAPHRQIPSELARIIAKAMATDPEERYQTVSELSSDLDALMAGETTSDRRTFEAGEILMLEGDAGEDAYVIVSGIVEVFKIIDGEEITLVSLSTGDVVGEMAMISDAPRSASVRAATDTEAVVITKETMQRGLSHLPPWMEQVIGAVVDRLRSASASVHPLMRSDCTWQVLQLLRLTYLNWGESQIDPDEGTVLISLDAQAAMEEIASIICIPRERIYNLLTGLTDSGLISIVDDNRLMIPNLEVFTAFIDYIRQRSGHPSTFQKEPVTELFADSTSLIVKQNKEGMPPSEDQYPVSQVPIEDLAGTTDHDDLMALFEGIRLDLNSAQQPAFEEEEHTRIELSVEDTP